MSVLLVCLSAQRMPAAQFAQLQAAAPDMRVVMTTERPVIEGLLDEIEIAVSIPHDLLARAPHLRWVQEWGAGVDWLLRHPEVAELDFTLTNASGVHAIPISEQILGYLLAFARGLPAAVRAQDRRAWQAPSTRVKDFAFFLILSAGPHLFGMPAIRLFLNCLALDFSSADM